MARADPFVEALATVPLFSGPSKRELQVIAKKVGRVAAPDGKTHAAEGAAGTEFLVIIEGSARVVRHGRPPGTPIPRRAPLRSLSHSGRRVRVRSR
ncbi:MAG TPA: hypothetical protein VGA62_01725 [Acidimicrobiia bacterium]